ncbi:sigma-70 family RNA polymerase sigma factor [Arenibacter sp. S6351L]|uniref:sigma-70 family RNA polymerase sigma factor n=1 Tax=Arenibacter sp. S6351L TaxID=2926407 RepID=UPI001FF1C04A|nr:sigma-70 family RNA polymerase sigma factor [Arenibacter sp. S6351L]MCK0136062.1 sigma-70 family RNA polymerase sigma factor [Arenibacter sp. S6351L]
MKTIHHRIEIVYKKHYREFCLLSNSYVSSSDLARDIVQDVFIEILMNPKSTEISNLKGYIWNSVKYASIKQIKETKRLTPIYENILVEDLFEDEPRKDVDLGPNLRSAMDKLPEQCKNVFELCALDGQKYQSAADSLGISVNTVKTQMKKAYRILRINLSDSSKKISLLGIIYHLLQ